VECSKIGSSRSTKSHQPAPAVPNRPVAPAGTSRIRQARPPILPRSTEKARRAHRAFSLTAATNQNS
jgi:hypothetical protein